MTIAETLLLFIQVGHFLLLGLSVFFLARYYSCGKARKAYYKGALKYGFMSLVLAILLFFILLHFGTMLEAIVYGISILLGILPIILAILGKD